jgi:hypothetical protein
VPARYCGRCARCPRRSGSGTAERPAGIPQVSLSQPTAAQVLERAGRGNGPTDATERRDRHGSAEAMLKAVRSLIQQRRSASVIRGARAVRPTLPEQRSQAEDRCPDRLGSLQVAGRAAHFCDSHDPALKFYFARKPRSVPAAVAIPRSSSGLSSRQSLTMPGRVSTSRWMT